MAVISATKMTFDDIIHSVWPFEKADEAMEYVWQGCADMTQRNDIKRFVYYIIPAIDFSTGGTRLSPFRETASSHGSRPAAPPSSPRHSPPRHCSP